MKVTCIGGAGAVTGSCYLIESEGARILVDCGMFQGGRQLEERNFLPFPFEPFSVSHLLLTHAHIDHTGLVPKLVKAGFNVLSFYSLKRLNSASSFRKEPSFSLTGTISLDKYPY